MPRDDHKKAADHHDEASKAHRTAAEHHGKDDHKIAHGHSQNAAHTKSQVKSNGK